MQIIIPQNLNLEEILIKKYPEYYAHLQKFYFIVSYILFISYCDHRYKDLTEISKKARNKLYIPINAKYLQNICGSNYYKGIVSILLTERILETDNHYLPKQKCKGYRIVDDFLYNQPTNYEIKDKKLEQRIKAKQNKANENLSKVNKQILEIIKSRFIFDLNSAFKVITQQKKTNIINDKSFNSTYNQLLQLQNNNFYFSSSPKTERIFHNYSNLKKDLRNFIKHISGEKLIEIDIANSQPFFLGCIISMLEQTNDTQGFISIVQSGNFYDYLRKNISSDLQKKNILTMLYCQTYWDIKHKDKFTELFPTVSKVIDLIKAEDYRNLAIELQSREADMILKTIAPILLNEKIDFIPIHDSFLIKETDKNRVTEIFEQCFMEKYKIIPRLKIKNAE